MEKDYSIGLDIGTNSVGWAVVRDDYTVVRKKMKVFGDTDRQYIKKNFMGSLLFDEGETAKDRRLKRTQRRRYERRRYRLKELQKIFAPAMSELDENFFHRLNESFLIPIDKKFAPYFIFGNLEMERDYHKKYPTIYHLRQELADSNKQADLRLVYLSLAHILKYRGHFLIEGELNTEDISIEDNFKQLIETFNALQIDEEDTLEYDDLMLSSAGSILKEKISKSRKHEALRKIFSGVKRNSLMDLLFKLIAGLKADFTKLVGSEQKIKFSMNDEDCDESLETLLSSLGDEYIDLFINLKKVYNAVELADILDASTEKTNAKLSGQMVRLYEEHKKQLAIYRKVVREHEQLSYRDTFHDVTKDGYAGYIHGNTNQENFYKYVKDTLKDIKEKEQNEDVDRILEWIESEQFLRKQRSVHNSVIPHQVHAVELDAIIKNQGRYYPFLKENGEKIKLLLNFRIPYYVGPLANGQSEFAWVANKKDQSISPWTFEETVDLDKSAEAFIERLTNYDTYLPDEKVLPKNSLLYQKFSVFNELTRVSYQDEQGDWINFSSSEKLAIFNALFKTRKRVTEKQLIKFIENHFEIDGTAVKGIENAFNANYSTYIDLSKIKGMKEILDDPEKESTAEEIVKILTIFEDKKMRKRRLELLSDLLSEDIIKELAKIHFTGWGKLSAKLIDGICDVHTQKTVMDYLINDDILVRNKRYLNRNFMQLINDDTLSFKQIISDANKVDLDENLTDMVSELPGSPAIKKGIHLSIRIVDEIVRIMGKKPKNIVIEMARENQTTEQGKNRSKSREAKIKSGLTELGSKLLKEDPLDGKNLNHRKVYLYYLQNGRDMYTGEAIDSSNLSAYDIDHIIPQSFLYDDSTDNVVLTKRTANMKKLDDVPGEEIVNRQIVFWRSLKNSGLMTQRKFDNLTKSLRGGLTERDKERFLNRQLVETRQITKHVANILDARMNPGRKDSGQERETSIVLIKSTIAGSFRKIFELYKVRGLNDYHHAHDAYLNAVIALKTLDLYPYMAKDFIYGDYNYKAKFSDQSATGKKKKLNRLIAQLKTDWGSGGDIEKVKKVLAYRQVNVVKKTEKNEGALFNETIMGRGKKKEPVPIKKELDPLKYGGYDSVKPAFYVAVSVYKSKKSRSKKLVAIPIKDQKQYEEDPLIYLEGRGYREVEILAELKNYTLFELPDGTRRLISGAQELQKANQLVLNNELTSFLYHIQHYDPIRYPESYEYVNRHVDLFDVLFEEIIYYAIKYLEVDKIIETLKAAYEGRDHQDLEYTSKSFENLLKLVKAGASTSFEFFGKDIPRKRYNSVSQLWKSQIIFQSLTGLYETRIILGE